MRLKHTAAHAGTKRQPHGRALTAACEDVADFLISVQVLLCGDFNISWHHLLWER